jgi:hypothetical protein
MATTMRAGVAGAIASMEGERLISRTVQDAAGIAFGLAVEAGTEENTCITGSAGPFLGVTVMDRGISPDFPNGFAQYTTARIMTQGVLWVEVTEAVNQKDLVKYDPATKKWGKTAGVNFGVARFESKTTAGGIAKLSLGDTHPVVPSV